MDRKANLLFTTNERRNVQAMNTITERLSAIENNMKRLNIGDQT